jgi:hypothetical protein
MKKFTKMLIATVIAVAAAQASALVLPTANAMSAGQYGDFLVYSLDLLSKCQLDPRCTPYQGDTQDGLNVQSSPGQISDNVIIYAASDGTQLNNYATPSGPFTGLSPTTVQVDNNFLPPTGNTTTFNTLTSTEPVEPDIGGPGGDVNWAGDKVGTWEAKLSTIVDFLNGGQLVFMFDNNQQGTDLTQQQFFWAQLTITDSFGNAVGGINPFCLNSAFLGTGVFDPNTNACTTAPFVEFTDYQNPGSFVGSGGRFCVDKVTGDTYLPGGVVPGNEADCTSTGGYFVSNNLGTSLAEFAVYSQRLNDNLLAWAAAGYFMSIDFRMRGLNDSGEQLWIEAIPRPGVPEPGTLALVALAMIGAAGIARRRQAR